EGEERILVPSPKVATYDLKPEMSADEVTDRLVAEIDGGGFDLIVVNYANPDMVGHTGKLAAAIAAVETVDHCLGRLEAAVRQADGRLLITADHGNVETMVEPKSTTRHTAHTTNRVPALLVNAPVGTALADGRLADIAPTLLRLLDLPQPGAMAGASLLSDEGSAMTGRRRSRASA
ncbi:MAG: alkaline phosphatase family protein, partial [Alphaproteobacteria bacterium]|nr:alkaline phosphatase family protein [Alphaproteobacteria bacterium]